MAKKIRVVAFGLGPVGCGIANLAARKKDVASWERSISEMWGRIWGRSPIWGAELGIRISDDAAAVLKRTKPEVVLHATGSSFPAVYPQLEMIIKAGASVVSTCEELSYPFRKTPQTCGGAGQAGEEAWGSRHEHGGQPGVFNGYLASGHDRRLPGGEKDPERKNSGCFSPASPLSKEDRSREKHRRIQKAGEIGGNPACGAARIHRHDRRRPRVEAGQNHGIDRPHHGLEARQKPFPFR